MQNKLLSKNDLMFNQACKILSSMELAQEIAGKTKDLQSVNAVREGKLFHRREKGKFKGRDDFDKGKYQKKKQRLEESKCYRCAGKHSARDCRFKNEKCHVCNKIGHIARACRNKRAARHTQYVEAEN